MQLYCKFDKRRPQIVDSIICVSSLALKKVRTRRRSLSSLPRPLMKWSPCLKIVIPGPLAYRRVRETVLMIFVPNCSRVESKFCCVLPVTTLRQRLLQPDFQPAGASQLHPRHKHLLMKRSLRCRVSATSGFYSPVSIKGCCFYVDHTRTTFVFLISSLQKCEHNLSKPEFNPTSIKFKIQLVAV